jgi:hypothetical protein
MSSRTTYSNFLGDLCQFVWKALSVVACTASGVPFFCKHVCFLIATDSHNGRNPFHNNFLFRRFILSCFSYYPCRHFVSTIAFQCPSAVSESVSMRFLSADVLHHHLYRCQFHRWDGNIFAYIVAFFQSIFLAVHTEAHHVVSDRAIRIICPCSFQLVFFSKMIFFKVRICSFLNLNEFLVFRPAESNKNM